MRSQIAAKRVALAATLICTAALVAAFAQQIARAAQAEDAPETVLATYLVKTGQEAEFTKVMAQAWPMYHKLGVVFDKPHLILEGKDESGKTYFVEVLTWKSHDAPDRMPAEVQALWTKMQALCEPRGGHRGIEIAEVNIVGSGE